MDGRRKFPLEIAWEQAGRELEEEMRQRADPRGSRHIEVRDHEMADGPMTVRGHRLQTFNDLEVIDGELSSSDC